MYSVLGDCYMKKTIIFIILVVTILIAAISINIFQNKQQEQKILEELKEILIMKSGKHGVAFESDFEENDFEPAYVIYEKSLNKEKEGPKKGMYLINVQTNYRNGQINDEQVDYVESTTFYITFSTSSKKIEKIITENNEIIYEK